METTFSDDEKRFVLGEMIKKSGIDISTLVEFIKAHHVEPDWMSMQLPGGRNMYQCMGAAENMFQAKFPAPTLGFKRKSMSDLTDPPNKKQALMIPTDPPPMPQTRIIQPRPPPNGYHVSASGPPPPPPPPPSGKKRGRPSKADKEAQARASSSRTMPPITPAPLAPMTLHPSQRDYASSPGYEISANAAEQTLLNRPKPTAHDNLPQQPSGNSFVGSPASGTGTPRALPDTLDQAERVTLSPRDRGLGPLNPRSPPILPPPQQRELPRGPSPMAPRPSLPPPTRSQIYGPYRGPDPIFPDRDRSRNTSEHLPQEPAQVPTISNRN